MLKSNTYYIAYKIKNNNKMKESQSAQQIHDAQFQKQMLIRSSPQKRKQIISKAQHTMSDSQVIQFELSETDLTIIYRKYNVPKYQITELRCIIANQNMPEILVFNYENIKQLYEHIKKQENYQVDDKVFVILCRVVIGNQNKIKKFGLEMKKVNMQKETELKIMIDYLQKNNQILTKIIQARYQPAQEKMRKLPKKARKSGKRPQIIDDF